jgi:hypothetical protein
MTTLLFPYWIDTLLNYPRGTCRNRTYSSGFSDLRTHQLYKSSIHVSLVLAVSRVDTFPITCFIKVYFPTTSLKPTLVKVIIATLLGLKLVGAIPFNTCLGQFRFLYLHFNSNCGIGRTRTYKSRRNRFYRPASQPIAQLYHVPVFPSCQPNLLFYDVKRYQIVWAVRTGFEPVLGIIHSPIPL